MLTLVLDELADMEPGTSTITAPPAEDDAVIAAVSGVMTAEEAVGPADEPVLPLDAELLPDDELPPVEPGTAVLTDVPAAFCVPELLPALLLLSAFSDVLTADGTSLIIAEYTVMPPIVMLPASSTAVSNFKLFKILFLFVPDICFRLSAAVYSCTNAAVLLTCALMFCYMLLYALCFLIRAISLYQMRIKYQLSTISEYFLKYLYILMV